MAKALVTGSFDPVTLGHMELISRAAAIFDSVVVGIFVNSSKNYVFSAEERADMLREACAECGLGNVTVDICSGLVARYVEENCVDVIVKGARNSNDFEYERNMAEANKLISPKAETLVLFSDPKYSAVSSSLVRTMVNYGEDVSNLVPRSVLKRIKSGS